MHSTRQHTPVAKEVKAEMFTWCSLQLAHYPEVMKNPSFEQPENILLTYKVGLVGGAAVRK